MKLKLIVLPSVYWLTYWSVRTMLWNPIRRLSPGPGFVILSTMKDKIIFQLKVSSQLSAELHTCQYLLWPLPLYGNQFFFHRLRSIKKDPGEWAKLRKLGIKRKCIFFNAFFFFKYNAGLYRYIYHFYECTPFTGFIALRGHGIMPNLRIKLIFVFYCL